MDDKVKELLEKLRTGAVNVGAAAGSTLREASARAGETIEITKLNMKIFDLNSEINQDMRKLGEIMYATHSGGVVNETELDALLCDVDDKRSEIKQYRERIRDMKKTTVCPMCGASCSRGDRFCRKCGADIG